MAKCQVKTSIRELGHEQKYVGDSLVKLQRNVRDFDERLHGLELSQERQNSST